MINYSIVIPHKNTPDLLQYCLDSIPVRDDVQVIVVDDNSDASKVDFNHFPQWEGSNYEYYLTKEGKGAGYARNVGLEHMSGKWVLFVDADDFLLPAVNEIFDEEKNTDADIVFFRPRGVMVDDHAASSKRDNAYNELIDNYFDTENETRLRCFWFSPCSRFFRGSLIRDNSIFFDEIRYSNDNLFSATCGVKAKMIAVRDKSFYCITESANSLTSNFMKKPGELSIRADAFFRAQMVLHDYDYQIDEGLAFDFLRRLFTEEKKMFVINFKRMRKMGYKKTWLLRELFKNNSRKARIKRVLYAYVVTCF